MTNPVTSINSHAVAEILEKIKVAMDEMQQPKKSFGSIFSKIFYWLGVTCFMVALALSLPFMRDTNTQFYGEYLESARDLTVSLLLISYFIMLAYCLGFIAFSYKSVKKCLMHPYDQIMKNVSTTAEKELPHFQSLLTHDVRDLRYVLSHLRSETVFFQSRASLIVGSLTKVGIFPALLAFFSLVQKMSIPSNGFLQALVYTIPVLYFLSFYDVYIKAKMDRHAALLELAISEIEAMEEKKEKAKARRNRVL